MEVLSSQGNTDRLRAMQVISCEVLLLWPHHKFILKPPKWSSFSVVIKLLLSLTKESLNIKIKPFRAFSFQCEHLFLIKKHIHVSQLSLGSCGIISPPKCSSQEIPNLFPPAQSPKLHPKTWHCSLFNQPQCTC